MGVKRTTSEEVVFADELPPVYELEDERRTVVELDGWTNMEIGLLISAAQRMPAMTFNLKNAAVVYREGEEGTGKYFLSYDPRFIKFDKAGKSFHVDVTVETEKIRRAKSGEDEGTNGATTAGVDGDGGEQGGEQHPDAVAGEGEETTTETLSHSEGKG